MTKPTLTKKMTIEEQHKKVFNKLLKLIQKEKLEDTSIYFEGKRYSYDGGKDEVKVIEDINVQDYLEFCNPNGVSITFEGALNYAINYGENKALLKKFEAVTKGTDLYYQLGYSWSASYYD